MIGTTQINLKVFLFLIFTLFSLTTNATKDESKKEPSPSVETRQQFEIREDRFMEVRTKTLRNQLYKTTIIVLSREDDNDPDTPIALTFTSKYPFTYSSKAMETLSKERTKYIEPCSSGELQGTTLMHLTKEAESIIVELSHTPDMLEHLTSCLSDFESNTYLDPETVINETGSTIRPIQIRNLFKADTNEVLNIEWLREVVAIPEQPKDEDESPSLHWQVYLKQVGGEYQDLFKITSEKTLTQDELHLDEGAETTEKLSYNLNQSIESDDDKNTENKDTLDSARDESEKPTDVDGLTVKDASWHFPFFTPQKTPKKPTEILSAVITNLQATVPAMPTETPPEEESNQETDETIWESRTFDLPNDTKKALRIRKPVPANFVRGAKAPFKYPSLLITSDENAAAENRVAILQRYLGEKAYKSFTMLEAAAIAEQLIDLQKTITSEFTSEEQPPTDQTTNQRVTRSKAGKGRSS